jgi:hypothetical protein
MIKKFLLLYFLLISMQIFGATQKTVTPVATPQSPQQTHDDRKNHNSEYIKEWVNGPSAIAGQSVPQGYVSPFTEDYKQFKNSNMLNQLVRQLHDRKITLTKALDGLDDNSRAELAHLYRVRFKNENLWTSPTVLK